MSAPRFPYPVELDAARIQSDAEIRRLLESGTATNDYVLTGLALWLEAGRVCYRLEADLLHALLLTDPPEELSLAPPHDCFWVDLERLVPLAVQGEPLVGFWLGIIDWKELGEDRWSIIAISRPLADGSHHYFWSSADPDPHLDSKLSDDERVLAETLRRIAVIVTLYLMDPAREETEEPLHGNRAWRERMKAETGAKAPDRHFPLVRHRVLGRSYRIPDDAHAADGTRLGLRVPVRGHIRMQRIGVGRRDVRATWVRPHWRGPESAATTSIVADVQQPEAPALSEEERIARLREAMARLESKLDRERQRQSS